MVGLADVLTELGIPFKTAGEHHHVSRGWLGIDCPLCSPDSGRYRMGLNPRSLAATCYQCGRQRLGDVLAAASGRPVRDVLKYLPSVGQAPRQDDVRPTGRYTAPPGLGPLLPAHRRYITDRGFDPDELVELWGLGGIGPLGRLKWRIFIPIYTKSHKLVSWTTRAIGENSGQRYISAAPEHESVPGRSLLYGEWHCRHAVAVVEGPFDVYAIGPGAAGIIGLTYTPAQVARIASYPVRCIAFDNEPGAQRRARQLAAELELHPGETYIVQFSGKDPGSSPASEIAEFRKRFLD